jgi:PAS domain S-box-containing protein
MTAGRVSGLLGVLMLLLAVLGAQSVNAAERRLSVGFFPSEPFLLRDDDGRVQGFFPDVLGAVAERAGWTLVYEPCGMAECLERLAAGQLDIVPAVARTRERAERLRFGREAVLHSHHLLYMPPVRAASVDDVLDLAGRRIAVAAGSRAHDALIRLAVRDGLEVDVFAVDSLSSALGAVAGGQAGGGLVPREAGAAMGPRLGLAPADPRFFPITLYLAFAPGSDDAVVSAADAAIAEMRDAPGSAYADARARWLPAADGFEIPAWLYWVVGGTTLVLLVSVGANVHMQRVIRERTAALRAQRNRLKALFDHAPMELSLKDSEGRYVEVNRRFEALFGRRNPEVVGRLPRDVLEPALAETTHAHDMRVLETGEPEVATLVADTEAGRKVFHTIKFPLSDTGERVSGLGAAGIDLTELHEARERAERAEQRLRDAINAMPGGFALFDRDDRLVLCNEAFREIYPEGAEVMQPGASFEQILRAGLARRQYPDALGREETWLEERLIRRHRGGASFEQQLVGDRWLKVFDIPTSDGSIVSVRLDITALKRQQRALEGARQRAEAAARKLGEQTRKLEQAVRISGIGGWEHDLDLDELSWDGITRQIYEVPPHYTPRPEEALRFLAPESRRALERALQDAVERLEPVDEELEVITAQDRRIWVRTLAQPVVEAGRVRRVAGVIQDITAQRGREQAIEQSRLEAEKANVAKSQFLANMSHEIRTPMNGVTGMLALLLASPLGSEQRRQAEVAHASAKGLMRILNDILDYSKLEANEMEIEAAPFDPRAVIEEVAEMLALRAREKELTLATQVSPAVPRRVIGDPARLRQVLVNLVSNAIKFTDAGRVEVRARREGRRVVFEVEDTGLGIPAGARKTLFTRFAQVHRSRQQGLGGTGLGLAISKQLVEAMEGRIGVNSEIGRGSLFWFWLPLLQPGEAAGPGRHEAAAEERGGG